MSGQSDRFISPQRATQSGRLGIDADITVKQRTAPRRRFGPQQAED